MVLALHCVCVTHLQHIADIRMKGFACTNLHMHQASCSYMLCAHTKCSSPSGMEV